MNLRVLTLSILSCFLLLSAPAPVHAVSISFGPVLWCSWWDPFLKDDLRYTYNTEIYPLNKHIKSKFSMGPALLYGPTASVEFLDRWAVSGTYMMSTPYKGKRSDADFDLANALDAIAKANFTVYKSDLDASASCKINEWVKVFAAFKWQHYDFREKLYIARDGYSGDLDTNFGESNGYGAVVGLGFTASIIKNLNFLADISGLYLRSKVDVRSEQLNVDPPGPISPRLYLEKERFNIFGGNISTSLAYFIEPISTTLTLGFRYQFMRYYVDHFTNHLYALFSPTSIIVGEMAYKKSREHGYNRTWDHIYGLTFSAVYTLEIAGSKNGKK